MSTSRDIALYLNFDMIGSPNPGYFTMTATSPPPESGQNVPRVPEGSPGIERTLMAYLKSAGKTQDTFFDSLRLRRVHQGRDPGRWAFSGAEENKTEEQAKLWGSTPNTPFDPNYPPGHRHLDQVDRTALGIQGAGVRGMWSASTLRTSPAAMVCRSARTGPAPDQAVAQTLHNS